MSDMSFETENSIDVNGSVIDSGIITQGLNLLIIPEGKQELCLALSIALSIADFGVFIGKCKEKDRTDACTI